MNTLNEKERHELSLLLPWYANGTLNSDDSRKVEAALARDEELAREYELVLEDQAALVDLVSEEEVPVSMAERFKAALNAQADEPAPVARRAAPQDSVVSRIVSALFATRPRAYAAVAAAIILLVPAVVIVSGLTGNQQTGQYQTATGRDEPATAKTRMLVKFSAGAAWSDIDAFLRQNSGQVVKGPTADGLYELEFEKAEPLAKDMGAETGIFEFVLPAN